MWWRSREEVQVFSPPKSRAGKPAARATQDRLVPLQPIQTISLGLEHNLVAAVCGLTYYGEHANWSLGSRKRGCRNFTTTAKAMQARLVPHFDARCLPMDGLSTAKAEVGDQAIFCRALALGDGRHFLEGFCGSDCADPLLPFLFFCSRSMCLSAFPHL